MFFLMSHMNNIESNQLINYSVITILACIAKVILSVVNKYSLIAKLNSN